MVQRVAQRGGRWQWFATWWTLLVMVVENGGRKADWRRCIGCGRNGEKGE